MTQRINTPLSTAPGTFRQNGFTLIELLLAITFISFILVFIVFAITQVMSNYNKGATIKEINQLARNATDVMSRDLRTSDITAVNVSALNDNRVCFGSISYVWNPKEETQNKYAFGGQAVRLTRVRDPGGAMCVKSSTDTYPDVPVGGVGVENALIPVYDEYRIWVNSIDVMADTALELVTVKVTLSTTYENQPVEDPLTGPSCTGDGAGSFCAVGTFETTVTTRNGGS